MPSANTLDAIAGSNERGIVKYDSVDELRNSAIHVMGIPDEFPNISVGAVYDMLQRSPELARRARVNGKIYDEMILREECGFFRQVPISPIFKAFDLPDQAYEYIRIESRERHDSAPSFIKKSRVPLADIFSYFTRCREKIEAYSGDSIPYDFLTENNISIPKQFVHRQDHEKEELVDIMNAFIQDLRETAYNLSRNKKVKVVSRHYQAIKSAEEGPGAKESDDVLVPRILEGEESAFKEFFSKYSNLVGSIAYNIIGDVGIAADITQEVFLKVHKKVAGLKDPSSAKAWLTQITRTSCIDHLRKEKNPVASIEHLAEEYGLEPLADMIKGGWVDGLGGSETEELRKSVFEGIHALSPIYRDIIRLRHLNRMSYKELSSHLNVPVATIESRLYRARIMLAEVLEDLHHTR